MEHNGLDYKPVGTKLRITFDNPQGRYLICSKSRHSTNQSKYLAELAGLDKLSFQPINPYGL